MSDSAVLSQSDCLSEKKKNWNCKCSLKVLWPNDRQMASRKLTIGLDMDMSVEDMTH